MIVRRRTDRVRSDRGSKAVFLNFPYDEQFIQLFLAYIAGVCSYGLIPRATLEPAGERRLEKIVNLIWSCHYSFHDLSRVESDPIPPRTPRMNMPFELGLTVMASYRNPRRHTWCVFGKSHRHVLKSLSDLGGVDPYCHHGLPSGVLREIGNVLSRTGPRAPGIRDLKAVYQDLRHLLPKIIETAGARSCYEARVFRDLVYAARNAVNERLGDKK
jgi:hypothetical protein